MTSRPWRWLVHPPADGAWNMAVDETLLDGYLTRAPGTAAPGPTLRLYAWRPAALSLGRFQAADTAHDASWLRANGVDLVRRPTGGGAVLHEHERTYAVAGRLRAEPFTGSVLETYRAVAQALCAALRALGLEAHAHAADRRGDTGEPACFGTPSAHEIAVDGLKLIGSAQLRRRGAFLQHGSLLIRSDPERLARAIGLADPPRGYTDLTSALGAAPDGEALDRCLASAFEETFSARLVRDELTPEERVRATRLRTAKYLGTAWTRKGTLT